MSGFGRKTRKKTSKRVLKIPLVSVTFSKAPTLNTTAIQYVFTYFTYLSHCSQTQLSDTKNKIVKPKFSIKPRKKIKLEFRFDGKKWAFGKLEFLKYYLGLTVELNFLVLI